MSVRATALTLFALLASTPAFAGSWDGAFPPAAAESHVGDDQPVIVVAADAKAAGAADALRAALTAGGSPLVMDESAAGNIAGKGDSEIAAAAGNLPVERIVIVRVFPGQGGETAVVSVFQKSGAAAGSFSVASGKVLASKGAGAAVGTGAPDPTSAGVSSAAIAAVESLHLAKGSAEAKQAFLEKGLWSPGYPAGYVNASSGGDSWSSFMRGQYGEKLTWRQFFETAGSDEAIRLLDEQEASNKRHRVRFWIGFVPTVGLSAAALAATEFPDAGPLAAGLAVAAVVPLGYMTFHGLKIDTALVMPLPDARRLADEYNKALLLELGLTEDDFALLAEPLPSAPRASSVRLTGVGAVPVSGGVALGLTGRF